jgi:lipopolysaccharide transport system ATP-binding protein
MSFVIRVQNLGKKYRIRHKTGTHYVALRDVLSNAVKNAGRRMLSGSRGRRPKTATREDFWALRDVNFEIQQGERVGIIGRNGAGKSTLLKILSRITEPTTGKAHIRGRVASLLEVGTGFHPELTGRENIFLNGAILGMRKTEIKSKFDEIVDFSGTSQFLDTPVKRYSSGMYVRLAFSIAAFLEPEILLVDEVLAVGDAEFQKKCLGKMDDVSRQEGRTIFFVSHNMNAVERLCSRVMIFEKGCLVSQGLDVKEEINRYIYQNTEKDSREAWLNAGDRYSDLEFMPLSFKLTDGRGVTLQNPLSNDSDIWVQIEGDLKRLDSSFAIGYSLYNEKSEVIYWTVHTDGREDEWPRLTIGKNVLRSQIPPRFLNEGNYTIELIGGLTFKEWFFEPGRDNPTIFLKIKGGLSDSPHWIARRPGILGVYLKWEKK